MQDRLILHYDVVAHSLSERRAHERTRNPLEQVKREYVVDAQSPPLRQRSASNHRDQE
jgi:hypothetical protein